MDHLAIQVTIFSAPKPFAGHAGLIQENAIRSWLALVPRPKVVLFSNDAGTAEAGAKLGVASVSRVETNAQGTPLVSSMFRQADDMAAGGVMAFVNADIILPHAVLDAAARAAEWSAKFLLVAQRWDVDVRTPLTFDRGWEQSWLLDAVSRARLHPPGGIDLFVYPRGQYRNMPPFAVGRTAYDNWLLWSTVTAGIPLIDATPFVTLVHQNHDYSHSTLDTWEGPEARENRRWIKHWSHYYTISHAPWTLGGDGEIRRTTTWKHRMARPRRMFSHAIGATRGIRSRIMSWRYARRYGGG